MVFFLPVFVPPFFVVAGWVVECVRLVRGWLNVMCGGGGGGVGGRQGWLSRMGGVKKLKKDWMVSNVKASFFAGKSFFFFLACANRLYVKRLNGIHSNKQ